MSEKPVYIVGAGGAGQSAYKLIEHMGRAAEIAGFLESPEIITHRSVYGLPVHSLAEFNPHNHRLLIAVGTSEARYQMVKTLPPEAEYASFIHPDQFILAPDELQIGEGSLIYPKCQFSRHVTIGKHAFVVADCILGHDSVVGDFFTSAARLNMGGGCQIGNRVYIGMSVSIRDHTRICDLVQIGMGSVVLKDICEPGLYVGNPAKKIRDLR